LAQLAPAKQIGAVPGKGTPLLHLKEQLLPAVSGVVQVKMPLLIPVMRELAGGLAHPRELHQKPLIHSAFEKPKPESFKVRTLAGRVSTVRIT